MKTIVLACIRAYQLVISPLIPPSCRFFPTCSEFSRQAIVTYGLGRGLILASLRILRCHPLHPGGYDPVENHRW